VDQALLDLAALLVPLPDLPALHRGQVLAVLGRGGGLVAAGRAGGPVDVHAHAGAVDLAFEDRPGQLREPDRVDLHEALDPGVGPAIAGLVAVQRDGHDDAPGAPVVRVVVVHEHRLAEEGPVALLDLLGGERVVVVVGPAGDHPGADVQVAGARVVVERDPVGDAGDPAGRRLAPRVEHFQRRVLEHDPLRSLHSSGGAGARVA
jgi:hypothetical protein